MASSSPVKILAVGSAVGSLKELFAKIKAIDSKHGKFDLVLCVGDFFGPIGGSSDETASLLKGEIEVPIPCYVMQGDHPEPQSVIEKFASSGSELCTNVFLMTKSGLFTTSHGLRIACLGGKYDEHVYYNTETPLGFSDPYFSSQTIEKLVANISSSSSSAPISKKATLAALALSSSQSHLLDILISNVWPASITNLSSSVPTYPNDPNRTVRQFDDLVRQSKPRYQFACGSGNPPQFWEREPFVWEQDEGRLTRFVALGAFGGEHGTAKKPRWFYAFSISPTSANTPIQQRPANSTENPFTISVSGRNKRPFETSDSQNYIFGDAHQSHKRPRQGFTSDKREGGKPPDGYKCKRCDSTDHFITECPERSKPPEGYICKICNVPGHLVRDCPEKHATGDTGGRKPPPGYVCRACASDGHLIQDCPNANNTQLDRNPRGRNRGPPKEITPNQCWFCLSNPGVAKHLIVSIGSECYLTLPKGQIIPTGQYAEGRSRDLPQIPGGGHVLIVPIMHYSTYSAIPPENSPPIVNETDKYKEAVRNLYAKYGCSPVAFEVSILSGKGGHAHVQVVPVLSSLGEGNVEAFFRSQAQQSGISFEEDPESALESCFSGKGSYFRVDLPSGKKLVHLITQSVPFGIQFGRQVLCNLLNIPERVDWKLCAQSDAEETDDAKAFKEVFAPFDTTQE